MKYKVGDKVKIKTWKSMKKEFGEGVLSSIDTPQHAFVLGMETGINKRFPGRILTIKEITNIGYRMEDIDCNWSDDMIECLYEEPIYKPITSRFEILDL